MSTETATSHQTAHAQPGADGSPEAPRDPAPRRPRSWRRRLAIAGGVLLAVGAGAYFGYPIAARALTTVSTDDAYVNGHVTFAAPRIAETVVSVLVDDNDFVREGDVLVVLDRDVEQTAVEQAEASLEIARKEVERQLAGARALTATARANRNKLSSAMTGVRNQVASLKTAVARLEEARAAERLAQIEAERSRTLGARASETQSEVQTRLAEYAQARARTRQALQEIEQIRVALELPERPADGRPLDDVPDGIDQRHSSVISALAVFAQNLADLGLPQPRFEETPDAYIERIHALAPNGDLNALIEKNAEEAPAVTAARAQVQRAEKDLALARLNLSYCEIRADIDGFISNRNVNPGNRVEPGQRLMAIRSAREIWIDCNFKETQLDPIRIGHPVEVYVDAYPGRVFRGRVTGFSPGTGQSLALLPAQNATGNFVKIVQRLPVRVELIDGNPSRTPLFIGLSATPYVLVHERPEGPNAGARLRAHAPTVTTSAPVTLAPADARATYPPTEARVRPSRVGPPVGPR